MTARSYAKNEADAFRSACEAAGIRAPRGCGPAAVRLLVILRGQAITRQQMLRTRGYSKMGTLIPAGFAIWMANAQLYTITPAGEVWLKALEAHKVILKEGGVA